MDWKKRFQFAVTLFMVIVLVGATAALAHGGDLNLIHACVKKDGSIRIIGAEEECAKDKETALDWGIVGPAGPKGDQGDPGPVGPAGADGSLALAGQFCPPFQFMVGVDTDGNIVCAFPRPVVENNADWTPYTQEFNGVLMALVPAGSFTDDSGTEHIFAAPFWIDVYEVTNAQYGSEGTFPGDNRPRDSVAWYDAKAHCEARGARLPDEWEWEYAARGPDALVYPWGNEFVSENVVWMDNNCGGTCDVGSRPSGVSWVGAYDMSGNVWEWMENDYGESLKVLRGGSFHPFGSSVNSAYRYWSSPTNAYVDRGFRCSRSN